MGGDSNPHNLKESTMTKIKQRKSKPTQTHRLGVKGRLFLAFFVVSALAISTSGISVIAFNRFGVAMDQVAADQMPSLETALTLSRSSEQLVSTLPILVAANNDAERKERLGITGIRLETLARDLINLKKFGFDQETVKRIDTIVASMGSRVSALGNLIGKRLTIKSKISEGESVSREAAGRLQATLTQASSNAANSNALPTIAQIKTLTGTIGQLQSDVLRETDPSMLELWPMQFMVSSMEMTTLIDELPRDLKLKITEPSQQILELGNSETGLSIVRKELLATEQEIKKSLGASRSDAKLLIGEVDALVEAAKQGVSAANHQTRNLVSKSTNIVTAMAVISLLVSVLIAVFYVGKNVIRRLNELHLNMKNVASGKLDAEVVVRGNDEISTMMNALQVFRDNALEKQRMEIEEKERERQVAEQRVKEIMDIAARIETEMQTVVQAVSVSNDQMKDISSSMGVNANAMADQSTSVATASGEVSSNVSTVASAAEQLAASISEIMDQVSQVATISGTAQSQAEVTNAAVVTLNQRAMRIDEVVSLISEIANKTRRLALNATIEAARAGEAGRGFSVVAEEVRGLADQTAQATNEISEQIEGMQRSSSTMTEEIERIVTTMRNMNEFSAAVATSIDQQRVATNEISNSAQAAADYTQSVCTNISSVAKQSSLTEELSSDVSQAAERSAEEINQLEFRLSHVLNDLRASAVAVG
jgi:methyl-accepting chemotaxis protein